MSCLINPTGWRLYYSKYWQSNYFISKKFYPLSVHTSRLVYAAVSSIINTFHLTAGIRRNILTFSTFKLLFFNNTIYILTKYKLYWRGLVQEMALQQAKRLLRKRVRSVRWIYARFRAKLRNMPGRAGRIARRRPQMRNMFRRLVQNRRVTVLWGRKFYLQRRVFNFMRFKVRRRFKKIFYYIYLLPIFCFLKNFFSVSLKKIVPKHLGVRSIFYGLNRRNSNALDILTLVDLYIRRRRYPAVKTLYILIRVLKRLKRRQKLFGFKFLLAGRFTRRDRATYLWKTVGGVSLGSRLSNVEYFSIPMFLNYSKCIARLWLCRL